MGIQPGQLAQAAKAIELGGRATSRTFLGLPIGVGQATDGAPLTGNLVDFDGEGASSPVVVRTEQGLALVKLP